MTRPRSLFAPVLVILRRACPALSLAAGLLVARSPAASTDLLALVTSVPVTAEDDRVMGGVSQSRPAVRGRQLVFSGRLSRDQGGGFASIEAENPALGPALRGSGGVRLQVRGDGRLYQLRFRQRGLDDSLWYKASFRARAGAPQRVLLPWSAFRASYHGRLQPGAPPLDPAAIRGLAFLTSDGPEGRFFLEVSALEPS